MKKRIIIGLIITVFIAVISIIFLVIEFSKNDNRKDLNIDNVDAISSLYPLISNQKSINLKLSSIQFDSKYTFDRAYVQLNPYGISPLSGIIIFSTYTEEEVDVYINGVFFTKMESCKRHIIPIYGLYEDTTNIVKLVMGDKEKEYEFKTTKSNIEHPVNVEIAESSLNDEIFFTAGSMISGLTGWDKEGKLRFYLTHVLKMDVEWLDNGHFLIGTPQGNDLDGYAATDRYMAFVEMDYLGKIYNYYTMPNSYDFEQQLLSDGTLMIGGGNGSIYYSNQVVYIFDLVNNNKVSEFNLSDAILEIDPNFDPSKLGPAAGKNGFNYDENTGELLVSFRQLNSLVSFNYIDKKLNWIITDKNNKYFQDDVWKPYLLESDFIPLGQHSPQILGDGKYLFYNNNYNRIDVPTLVKDHVNEYSEAQIFTVKDNKAKLEWTSASINEKYLTQKFGLFQLMDNGHYLIDFGWIPYDSYFESDTNTFQEIEGDVSKTYSVYLELDEKFNIVYKAICDEGKYRIFKHDLYNENTKSLDIEQLNIYENIQPDEYKEIKENINFDKAFEFINYYEFTKNTFYTDYEIKEDDSVKLLFVGNKTYEFVYKEKDNSSIDRVFNLELPDGYYKLYIEIDGVVYKTDKVYSYKK